MKSFIQIYQTFHKISLCGQKVKMSKLPQDWSLATIVDECLVNLIVLHLFQNIPKNILDHRKYIIAAMLFNF